MKFLMLVHGSTTWYASWSSFPNNTYPFIRRGGKYGYDPSPGMWSFAADHGSGGTSSDGTDYKDKSFRIVIPVF